MKHVSGLVYYWPLGESLADSKSKKDIKIKLKGEITTNRFNETNSALRFNEGYGEIQSGVYFEKSGFTFMIWVKVNSYIQALHQRIFEFGNGRNADNIALSINQGLIRVLLGNSDTLKVCLTNHQVELNKWNHYTVTVGHSDSYFYLNGNNLMACPSLAEFLKEIFENIERSKNLIGGSHWNDNEYSNFDGELDDLKIFNRQLSDYEIILEKENTGSKVYGQFLHIYQSMSLFTSGLVHYWPMAGSTNDMINSKHITIQNGNLTTDRFGNKQSGISLDR